MSDYTQDYLLDKQIKIFQPDNGYRASSDAVFLSSLPDKIKDNQKVLDVGSGTGAVSLCLAHRFPKAQIIGLEIQPNLAKLSNMSAQSNAFTNIHYINTDIRQPQSLIENGSFHHIITNPPYTDHDMPSPNPSKATAHNLQEFNLSEWISFCLKKLRPQGYFYMVNRAEALTEILSALYKKTGDIIVVPLFSKHDPTAKRILIRARKGSKAPTKIISPIYVHNPDGSYTPQAHQILRKGQTLFSTLETNR